MLGLMPRRLQFLFPIFPADIRGAAPIWSLMVKADIARAPKGRAVPFARGGLLVAPLTSTGVTDKIRGRARRPHFPPSGIGRLCRPIIRLQHGTRF